MSAETPMRYLAVRGWHKYQRGRRSRNAPWIKLHCSLLSDHGFTTLPMGARWMLLGVWMLTASRGHWCPMDATWLHHRLHMTRGSNTHEWLKMLLSRGFVSAVGTKHVPEREKEIEIEKEIEKEKKQTKSKRRAPAQTPSPGFALFWQTYPTRNGRKSGKREAWDAWKAIKAEPHTEKIVDRLKRQIEHKRQAEQGGRFVPEFPDAFRWLKKRRFNDEITDD